MNDLVDWRSIPGWFAFRTAYEEAVARAPEAKAQFVEVGSWKGRSTVFMANAIAGSGKDILFYAVDTWEGSDEPEHRDDPDIDRLFEVFTGNITPVRRYVRPIQKPSIEAAMMFPVESLDFVWLDAGHSYEDVKADIAAWRPRMKPGSVMGGDDVHWGDGGVLRAVREAFPGQYAIKLGEGGWAYWEARL